MTQKAIILLSGGLDSTTCLAIAQSQNYDCYALSFSYGQKHTSELQAAKLIAQNANIKSHKIIDLDLGSFGGSALTDKSIDIPEGGTVGIPVTYVPARNTVFLSIALGWAEVLGAKAIFAGSLRFVEEVPIDIFPGYLPVSHLQSITSLHTSQPLFLCFAMLMIWCCTCNSVPADRMRCNKERCDAQGAHICVRVYCE